MRVLSLERGCLAPLIGRELHFTTVFVKIPNAAGDPEDRKSTAGAIVFYHGNPVGWISQKQKTVSTSTSEAEYKTMTYAFKEGMYYYNLMEKEFKLNTTPIPTKMNSLNPVIAYGDNKGAIFMVKQRVSNNRSKHIDIDITMQEKRYKTIKHLQ